MSPLFRLTGVATYMVIIILSFASTSCINNIACQNPPPVFQFQIRDGNLTYPYDLDFTSTIKVWYLEASRQKYIEDISGTDDALKSPMLIAHSHDLNDPEFTIELNGRILSKIKLETYVDKGKCDGWAHISRLLEDGKAIFEDKIRIYHLGNK